MNYIGSFFSKPLMGFLRLVMLIQVNNAALVVMKGATEYTLEEYSSVMSTNVESSYHLCQLAHPLLKASGNASIVFMSSVAGTISIPRLSAYAASKGT